MISTVCVEICHCFQTYLPCCTLGSWKLSPTMAPLYLPIILSPLSPKALLVTATLFSASPKCSLWCPHASDNMCCLAFHVCLISFNKMASVRPILVQMM